MAFSTIQGNVSQATVSPSQRAKETAEKFIVHFSRTDQPDTVSSPWGSLLTEEERSELQEKVAVFAEQMINSNEKTIENSDLYFIGKGKHHIVWGHPKFPKLVFKGTSAADAKHQALVAEKAHRFAATQKPFWCRIPLATVVDVPNQDPVVYIEELLPIGMGMGEHQEFWARIFSYLKSSECSPVFKNHLSQLVNQIEALIENIGFWDVGEKNLPEVSLDGRYVCAVDFENVDPNLSKVGDGISRLACLFCHPPFVTSLSEKYCKNAIPLEVQRDQKRYDEETSRYGDEGEIRPSINGTTAFWKKNLEETQEKSVALQEVIKVYDQKGWISVKEEEIGFGTFDPKGMTEIEVKLAEKILSDCERNLKDNVGSCLSERRFLSFQPGYFYKQFGYTREGFVKLLNNLKEQGVIIHWIDDYENKKEPQRELACYQLWF